MTQFSDTANRPNTGFDGSALDRVDRILLGACAVVWLAALGAGVAATVALVDLTRGREGAPSESGTPWVLYTVIGVSAAVIVAAVPLLLRARRAGADDAAAAPQRPAAQVADSPSTPIRNVDAPTEKIRLAQATPEGSGPLPRVLRSPAPVSAASSAVDRLWLRSAASITCAMGAATLLIAVATYLMAVDSDTASWALYGVAGVVTVGMIAIPWYFLREMRADIDR